MEILKKIREYFEFIVFLLSCGILYQLKNWGLDNSEITLTAVPAGVLLLSVYFLRNGYPQYSSTRTVLIASVFLGSIFGTCIGTWFWLHSIEPFPKGTIGIYIARFSGDYGTSYRDEILESLTAEIEKAGLSREVIVKRLPKRIWGDKAFTKALGFGVKGNASIIIWGEFPSEKKVRSYLTFLGDIPIPVYPIAPLRIADGEGICLQAKLTETRVPEELIKKPLILINLILGYAHYKKGEHAKAITKLNRLVEENPNFGEVYYILGFVHFDKKDFEAAAQAFEKAMKTAPSTLKSPGYRFYIHIGLAASYLNMKDYDKAIEMYERAVRLFPNIPTTHFLLALAYGLQEKHEMAIKELAEAINIYSQYSGLEPMGGFPKVICTSDGITVSVYDEVVNTYYYLGKEHTKIGRYKDALNYFKKIAEIKPQHEDTQLSIVEILSGNRTVNESTIAWQALMGCSPDYMFYHRLGITYLANQREGDAIKALEKARELKPSYPYLYFYLGTAYLKQEHLKDAIKTYCELGKLDKELSISLFLFYRRLILSDEIFAEKLSKQVPNLPTEYQEFARRCLQKKLVRELNIRQTESAPTEQGKEQGGGKE